MKNAGSDRLITRSKITLEFIYFGFIVLFVLTLLVSVSIGSVDISIGDTIRVLVKRLLGLGDLSSVDGNIAIIIEKVRLPRVLLAGLVGASLSIAGTSMQGLLRNPLADSSTLGVSSFAALGAVFAMTVGAKMIAAAGNQIAVLPYLSVSITSIVFAFASFFMILALSHKIDRNLSTNTIILTGIIFSMFAGSIISFIVSLSGEQLKSIVFWTMGSFSGRGWTFVVLVAPFAAIGSLGLLRYANELNAFALGEEKAGYIGVNVKRVKTNVLILVSILVGISVSVSGTIAFVGLVIPHITRLIAGPNHKHLLPLSLLTGASFMMLADLISRTVLRPAELPIGVVTSLIGSVIFIYVFYSQNKAKDV